MTDYSKYPVSITALQADRTKNAADWTARDALIETLRRIDSGELNPEILVIAFEEPESAPEMVIYSPFKRAHTVGFIMGCVQSLLTT